MENDNALKENKVAYYKRRIVATLNKLCKTHGHNAFTRGKKKYEGDCSRELDAFGLDAGSVESQIEAAKAAEGARGNRCAETTRVRIEVRVLYLVLIAPHLPPTNAQEEAKLEYAAAANFFNVVKDQRGEIIRRLYGVNREAFPDQNACDSFDRWVDDAIEANNEFRQNKAREPNKKPNKEQKKPTAAAAGAVPGEHVTKRRKRAPASDPVETSVHDPVEAPSAALRVTKKPRTTRVRPHEVAPWSQPSDKQATTDADAQQDERDCLCESGSPDEVQVGKGSTSSPHDSEYAKHTTPFNLSAMTIEEVQELQKACAMELQSRSKQQGCEHQRQWDNDGVMLGPPVVEPDPYIEQLMEEAGNYEFNDRIDCSDIPWNDALGVHGMQIVHPQV